MHNYMKSILFTFILVLTAWDIALGTRTGIATQSFIQQESNLQPISNTDLVQPAGVSAIANTAVTSTQKSVNPNLQQSSNRGLVNSNSRDYVNPNYRATQNYPIPAQTGLQPNSPNSNSPVSPSRDYVNPNQNNPVSQTGLQPNPKYPNSPSRDYVNPNRPTGQNNPVAQTGLQPNSPNPNNPVSPSRDYVNPNRPTNQKNPVAQTVLQPNSPNPKYPNSPSRDYVNPNRPTGQNTPVAQTGLQPKSPNPTDQKYPVVRTEQPNIPKNQNAPRRDYVNPNHPPTPSTVKPPMSWAQKVSGGITTKSPPIVINKDSTGPPTAQTPTPSTKRPDDGPSDLELREFSEALLRRDVNNAAKYVVVNVQGKTTSQSQNDQAPHKLLEIQPEAYAIPTIAKIKLLHNNYILETTENEYVTAQEKNEENELLDAMLTTPIMQYTRNFLISQGKLAKDPKEFKNLLKVLWFNMYSRGAGRIGSSGFEHIFLAELKKNEVSGLHNWVYFDQAELGNAVDYLGYMKTIDLGEKGSILKFHFKLKGVDKPVGSMFIGTSPELEMALYTTCYLFRADRVCPLRLNGNNFIVRTYNFRYRGKNMIGSAFPEI